VLAPEERERLQLRLAEGWLRAGKLDLAEKLLAADSTVEALAILGLVALYRGDLATAVERLTSAGPYAGEREASTARAGLLALLQVIDEDSLPALGSALLQLERRDSARAAAALEQVAALLPPERGGAETLLLAGRVRVGLRQAAEAERLLRRVAEHKVPASAAAAELELARLWIQGNQRPPAAELLEHLLVTYPTSAVVPQARRLLDVARGAVPPV
jgi:tetratricopeptide (TPR) repeat protein